MSVEHPRHRERIKPLLILPDFRLQAMLTQLISNLVSPVSQSAEHQQMIESEYKAYLCGDREEDVITRLLDTPDPKVMLATLRYIHNIVRSSPERQ